MVPAMRAHWEILKGQTQSTACGGRLAARRHGQSAYITLAEQTNRGAGKKPLSLRYNKAWQLQSQQLREGTQAQSIIPSDHPLVI